MSRTPHLSVLRLIRRVHSTEETILSSNSEMDHPWEAVQDHSIETIIHSNNLELLLLLVQLFLIQLPRNKRQQSGRPRRQGLVHLLVFHGVHLPVHLQVLHGAHLPAHPAHLQAHLAHLPVYLLVHQNFHPKLNLRVCMVQGRVFISAIPQQLRASMS